MKPRLSILFGLSVTLLLLAVFVQPPKAYALRNLVTQPMNTAESQRSALCGTGPPYYSVYGVTWINDTPTTDTTNARWDENVTVAYNATTVDVTMWSDAYDCPASQGGTNIYDSKIKNLSPAPGGNIPITFPYGNSIYRGDASPGQFTDPPGSLRVRIDVSGKASGCYPNPYKVSYNGVYEDRNGTGASTTYFTSVCITRLPSPGWKLSGTTTVNNQSSLTVPASTSGTPVTFRHSVYNAGPSTATFNWKMQYRLNGGSWTDVNAGTSVTTAVNQYNPNQYAYVYTVPANSPTTFSYCQRTWYSDSTGPGAPASTSAAACVGVSAAVSQPPKGGNYGAICPSMSGYAYDPDIPTWGISVQVNVDGVPWQTLPANKAGSPAAIPGNHEFSYPTTSLKNSATGASYDIYNAHNVQVIALGINKSGKPDGVNTDLGTIYVPACANKPVGSFSLSCSGINGSAYDPDRPAWQIAVQVIINGQSTTLIANQYGTTGHGFSSAMSSLSGYNPTVAQNVQVIAYGVDGKGVADGYNGDLGTQTMPACYAATCLSASPNSSSTILAGSNISLSSVFRNDGPISWNDGGRVTARSSETGVTGGHYTSSGVPVPTPTGPGGTASIGYGSFPVPLTLATQSITMQLMLDNSTVIGTCNVSFDPFTTFTLTPSPGTLSLNPDSENPSSAYYASQIVLAYPNMTPDYPVMPGFTSSRTITKNGVLLILSSSSSWFASPVFYYTDTANTPPPNNLGDKYCGAITVSIISGWINKNSTVINAAGPPATASGSCATVSNKPYFRVYGGDINAGGAYTTGGTCAAPTGGNLFGQYRPGTGGAGTELAAIAQIKITGVASATLRTSSPTQPSGLTFANSGVITTPPDMGGDFAGAGYCAPDYFQDEQFSNGDSRKTTSTATSIGLASLGTGEQTVVTPTTGTLKIIGGSNIKNRHTLFVDGDVVIQNDITYASSAGVTDPSMLPYLTIIAKGNIYIDPKVTNIEGLFIAQYRNAASPGYIYTCNGLTTTTVPSDCSSKQLRITGAFIANRVLLQRAMGTLRDSPGPNEPASSPNIAEVFQFSPEQYIGRPVFKTKTGQYDSIKGLPPILH